ncbi:MAG: hypothetical protein QW613_07045, partial [Thermoprotei archaeon]
MVAEVASLLDLSAIQKRFVGFLTEFRVNGEQVYKYRVNEMVANKARSLIVDFDHVLEYDRELARSIQLRPDYSMPALKKALLEALERQDPEYAGEIRERAMKNQQIKGEISGFAEAASLIPLNVRFRFPQGLSLRLRELGAEHVDTLVQVEAVALRVSVSKPYLVIPVYRCVKCGFMESGIVGLT